VNQLLAAAGLQTVDAIRDRAIVKESERD